MGWLVLKHDLPVCQKRGLLENLDWLGEVRDIVKVVGSEANYALQVGLVNCKESGVITDLDSLKTVKDVVVSMGRKSMRALAFVLPACKRRGVITDAESTKKAGEILDSNSPKTPFAADAVVVLQDGLNACWNTDLITDLSSLERACKIVNEIYDASGDNKIGVELVHCEAEGVITDWKSLEAVRDVVVAAGPENARYIIKRILCPVKKAGVIGDSSDLKYVADRLFEYGSFEPSFWMAVNRTISWEEFESTRKEVEENKHIPLPVFIGLKEIFGDDVSTLNLSWDHINKNTDSLRTLVQFLGGYRGHRKELLSRLQGVSGKQVDSIIRWTRVLGNLGVDYYHDFTSPEEYEDELKDKAIKTLMVKMNISPENEQALISHPGVKETNLLEVLASLMGFMPENQKKLLTEMTLVYAKNNWSEWRYETGLGV